MLKVAPDIQYRLLGRLPTTDQDIPPATIFSVEPPREVSTLPPATSSTCRYFDNTVELRSQNIVQHAVICHDIIWYDVICLDAICHDVICHDVICQTSYVRRHLS